MAEGAHAGRDRGEVCRFAIDGVLGTSVELWLEGVDSRLAASVEAFVLRELRRLEAVFSVYDEGSELRRWRRGELELPGPEFADLMGRVLSWQERSGGVFNPFVGALVELWRRAERSGRIPESVELAATAEEIAAARFHMVTGIPVALGDCAGLNLNAIAKGYIVDQVGASCVAEFGAEAAGLNIGGDVRHWGRGSWPVGIENPLRPYDNEPPVAVVALDNAALATSGAARRGFRVAGEWFSHVLDARTGRPAAGAASVTVVAADVATADVAATVATVLGVADALEWLTSERGIAGLVIARDGTIAQTSGWTERFGPLRRA